ncbi:unnamed protein product [Schistosoma rodhaini]|uniref:Uncharacterized protein n=2 Tax=Schistosoma rodhaini TaxID=6188 RepID=A0AA85G5Q8_9TREM|nr:unnamed protein product [Schistosoma rodhaini]CAH8600028.1 unnamed protein product [Schistosoma rodhaini]
MKAFAKKRAPDASDNGPEPTSIDKVRSFFSKFGSGLRTAFVKPQHPSVPVTSRDVNNFCYSSDELTTSKEVFSASNETVDTLHPLSNMKGDRVSSSVRILNEPHGSSPRSSHIRGNVSPQNSAFRDELNSKLRIRPGHNLQPRITTIAKSAESPDSLILHESSSPNQKHLSSPYSSPYSTRVFATTPPNSTHESISSTPSSSGASEFVSLQHKLAVSRPRNRRPPSKTCGHALNKTDEDFVGFFSPSPKRVSVNNNFFPVSNPHLGLIKEESEIIHRISEQPHQEISATHLPTEILTVSTGESISENSNSNKLDSPLSRLNLRGSVKPAFDWNSLERKSDSYRKSDCLLTSFDQETITPFKPPSKNTGFERIKINSTSDFHNLTPLASYNGGDQHIRPRSMFIPSSGNEIQSSQICLKTKDVNNNLTTDHHDTNLNNAKRSSESIPSLVFVPCKASVDNNSDDTTNTNNHDSNVGNNNLKVSNQTTHVHTETKTHISVSMMKKPVLTGVEENSNKCSQSPSPQTVVLRRKIDETSRFVTLKDE